MCVFVQCQHASTHASCYGHFHFTVGTCFPQNTLGLPQNPSGCLLSAWGVNKGHTQPSGLTPRDYPQSFSRRSHGTPVLTLLPPQLIAVNVTQSMCQGFSDLLALGTASMAMVTAAWSGQCPELAHCGSISGLVSCPACSWSWVQIDQEMGNPSLGHISLEAVHWEVANPPPQSETCSIAPKTVLTCAVWGTFSQWSPVVYIPDTGVVWLVLPVCPSANSQSRGPPCRCFEERDHRLSLGHGCCGLGTP
jgi:hypothetical protein